MEIFCFQEIMTAAFLKPLGYTNTMGNIIFHTPLETPILYVMPLEIVPMGRLSIQAEFLTPLWGGLPTILFVKSREKPICFTTILPYQKVLRI
jgi:hypothetical protein